MKTLTPLGLIALIFFSCQKEQSYTVSSSPTGLLQHLWIIDSVMVYADSNVFGNYLMVSTPTDFQYEDFRADGKVYSYGGSPTVHFDTSAYKLLSDNVTLLAYPIKDGITSTKADTGYIIKLTDHALMYKNRNVVGEYARWVLKR